MSKEFTESVSNIMSLGVHKSRQTEKYGVIMMIKKDDGLHEIIISTHGTFKEAAAALIPHMASLMESDEVVLSPLNEMVNYLESKKDGTIH